MPGRLRIIDPAQLWNRVQSRLAIVGEKYNFKGRPGLAHRASTSPNFLTGFLKCGVCGHNLTVVTGRAKDGQGRYGCPINFKRGACTNGVKQRADEIEAHLLSEWQSEVLRPEAIDFAVQEFERQLQSSLAGLDNRIGRMRQRASQVQQEIANLAATAAQCGPTPALVNEINTRQRELDEITRQLLSAEPDSKFPLRVGLNPSVRDPAGLAISVTFSRWMFRRRKRHWRSTSPAYGWFRKLKEKKATTSQKGSGISWGDTVRKPETGQPSAFGWLRGKDLNLRPLGYEPNELPDCSTPHAYGSEPVHQGQTFGTYSQHLRIVYDSEGGTYRHVQPHAPGSAASKIRSIRPINNLNINSPNTSSLSTRSRWDRRRRLHGSGSWWRWESLLSWESRPSA